MTDQSPDQTEQPKLTTLQIRVNDAMADLFKELGVRPLPLMRARVELTLTLLGQRLLADAAIVVNENYPAPVGGGSWPWPTEVDLTPTRYELTKMIQGL